LIQTYLARWNIAQLQHCTEAEFLDVIGPKILRVILLAREYRNLYQHLAEQDVNKKSLFFLGGILQILSFLSPE
jgi:hypothetical protein